MPCHACFPLLMSLLLTAGRQVWEWQRCLRSALGTYKTKEAWDDWTSTTAPLLRWPRSILLFAHEWAADWVIHLCRIPVTHVDQKAGCEYWRCHRDGLGGTWGAEVCFTCCSKPELLHTAVFMEGYWYSTEYWFLSRFFLFQSASRNSSILIVKTVIVSSTVRILSYSLNKNDVLYQVKKASSNSLSLTPAQTHKQVALITWPETEVLQFIWLLCLQGA